MDKVGPGSVSVKVACLNFLFMLLLVGCGEGDEVSNETNPIQSSSASTATQAIEEGLQVLRSAENVFGAEAVADEMRRFNEGSDALKEGNVVTCGSGWRVEISFLTPEADNNTLISRGRELIESLGYEPAPNNPASASPGTGVFVVGGDAPRGRRVGLSNSGGRPFVSWVGECSDDPSMKELYEKTR